MECLIILSVSNGLLQILATDAPALVDEYGSELFKNFLRAEILPVFARHSRRIEDLQVRDLHT